MCLLQEDRSEDQVAEAGRQEDAGRRRVVRIGPV